MPLIELRVQKGKSKVRLIPWHVGEIWRCRNCMIGTLCCLILCAAMGQRWVMMDGGSGDGGDIGGALLCL